MEAIHTGEHLDCLQGWQFPAKLPEILNTLKLSLKRPMHHADIKRKRQQPKPLRVLRKGNRKSQASDRSPCWSATSRNQSHRKIPAAAVLSTPQTALFKNLPGCRVNPFIWDLSPSPLTWKPNPAGSANPAPSPKFRKVPPSFLLVGKRLVWQSASLETSVEAKPPPGTEVGKDRALRKMKTLCCPRALPCILGTFGQCLSKWEGGQKLSLSDS